MSLYAIGDLHFSTLVEKPMNIFGDKWEKHEEKILYDHCSIDHYHCSIGDSFDQYPVKRTKTPKRRV